MKRTVVLSRRMQAAADMVSKGNRVCDVGCDHGYVSIWLLQSGKVPSALAMDVNNGPLQRAAEHVRRYGVEKYITLRLSDGLSAYRTGEADTLLCAGMGGRLLMDILTKEPDKTKDFKELVLQPQSEVPVFRKFLREKGYIFLEEDMILEEGKFYPLMKVKFSDSGNLCDETCEMEDLLGPLLLKKRHPVLFAFIKKEISVKGKILDRLKMQEANDRNEERKRELQKELTLLKEAEALWRL